MVNVRPDRNFEYPLLHSKVSQRINPLPQTIKGNCYFYWFVTEFGEDQHISILTENYCQEKNSFPLAIHSVINHNRGRHSREGGNPGKHWIPPYQVRGRLSQARNDKPAKI